MNRGVAAKVRLAQMASTEEEEDGVVCGHLTLGPSFAVGDNSSVRTASSNRLKQQTFSKV